MVTHQLRLHDSILEYEEAKGGAIRWAVGSADGLRSSTWRLWGNKKGNIYISCRSMGHIVKASFHPDRNCHVGFTSEYADTARKRFSNISSRHWEKWTIPDEPMVRAIQIVLPASELRSFPATETAQLRWLPAPLPNSVSIVSIFIAHRGAEMKWPGSAHGTLPLGVIVTEKRVTWAVYSSNSIDAKTKVWIEDNRSKLASMPVTAETLRKPGIRAVLFGDQEGHSKFFIELSLS